MTQTIDLVVKPDDEVYFMVDGERRRGRVLSITDGIATIRWKHGPRYDDFTQSEVLVRGLVFACHHAGAPFERITADPERLERDGYASGLSHGLYGQFYGAGGPHVRSAPSSTACRHEHQWHDFEIINHKAWRKGWVAGQEKARMKKKLDFTGPLRTVKEGTKITYVGPVGEGYHAVSMQGTGTPPRVLTIDDYGAPAQREGFGYGFAIENAPIIKTQTFRVTGHLPSGELRLLPVADPVGGNVYVNVTLEDGRPVAVSLV